MSWNASHIVAASSPRARGARGLLVGDLGAEELVLGLAREKGSGAHGKRSGGRRGGASDDHNRRADVGPGKSRDDGQRYEQTVLEAEHELLLYGLHALIIVHFAKEEDPIRVPPQSAAPHTIASVQRNVEMVRRWFTRIAEERTPDLVPEFWEPDSDYYPVRKFPESRPCHGHEEIEDFLARYLGAWERYEHRINGTEAIGDDRVLVHAEIAAEGSTSGVALAGNIFHSCWLRHGRFIRVEDHLTERGARDALGLT